MTLAWHFLKDDGTTAYGGLKPEVGKTTRAKGPLVLCSNGMHASVRAIDGLKYAEGAVIERVEMLGKILVGDDKLCARGRKTLWMYDASRELHEFACREALRALRKTNFTDKRFFDAIATKRMWLRGKASDDDLAAARDAAQAAAWHAAWHAAQAAAWDAAWDAAQAAAWDAARDAARDAAWDAAWHAAQAAAWDAARDAARDAAWDAARDAARDAAWDAARDAARDAAWDAAWDAQNKRLEKMIIAGARKRGLIEGEAP